jgi:SsrA-binding protein
MAAGEKTQKTLVQNRRAHHDYYIEETLEVGIALHGSEVKSIRIGQANLKESYCAIRDGELWLLGAHISPYEKSGSWALNPTRDRRLLAHKREIRSLQAKVKLKGLTLIPLRMYLKAGRVKIELALARGKKLYDKREAKAGQTVRRDMERALARSRQE